MNNKTLFKLIHDGVEATSQKDIYYFILFSIIYLEQIFQLYLLKKLLQKIKR